MNDKAHLAYRHTCTRHIPPLNSFSASPHPKYFDGLHSLDEKVSRDIRIHHDIAKKAARVYSTHLKPLLRLSQMSIAWILPFNLEFNPSIDNAGVQNVSSLLEYAGEKSIKAHP
jgi:hypothetical protein